MESEVKLTVDKLKVRITNGILDIKFNERAMVTSLIKNNRELVKNLSGSDRDPDKDHSFYVDYHAEGKFRNFKVSDLKVIKYTKDEAHIRYIDNESMLYIEYNIIMKSGESGIYSYIVAKNNLKKEFKLDEFRTVYRLDHNIFDTGCNAERKGKQPTCSYMWRFKKIQDETYEMPDGENYSNGKIYSKYDYASYFKDNHFWGQYGHGFGFWFIPVSTEYYPSGPLKQELLFHYDGIILNYMTGAHFGTGSFQVPEDWGKFYGPWYIYINSGDEKQLISDAEEKAEEEEKKWPYKWVDEKLYPVNRAVVTGKLKITHNRSSSGCVVVLAKPGGEFIRQKGDYVFYTKADEDGNFKIKNVRYGDYALYAYSTKGDITDELESDNVRITEENSNLGEITWNPPHYRKKIWQIGIANRSASEFKFGNELRNYKWQELVPANLDYIVGKSSCSEDWYYAQTKPGNWNIRFNMDSTDSEDFYLTIAIASATKGKINLDNEPDLTVKLNGLVLKKVSYINDTSIYRSAMKSGWYHLEKIKVDAKFLKLGENVVTLSTSGAIMYDTILFQSN